MVYFYSRSRRMDNGNKKIGGYDPITGRPLNDMSSNFSNTTNMSNQSGISNNSYNNNLNDGIRIQNNSQGVNVNNYNVNSNYNNQQMNFDPNTGMPLNNYNNTGSMNMSGNQQMNFDPNTGMPLNNYNNMQRPINNMPNNQQMNFNPNTGMPMNNYNNTPNPMNRMPNNQSYGNGPMGPNVKPKNPFRNLGVGFIVLIIFLIVFGFFIWLFKDGALSNASIGPKKSRTLMIYMVGSDLESSIGLGTSDLSAIKYSKTSENDINIVLMAGGSKKWYNRYITYGESSIYELKSGGFTKVRQQDNLNMGDASSLSSFLNYVYENYKSDTYDLIFWNHGAAILGSEFDELHGGDGLELTEIDTAFKKSPFNSNNKLELIMFRTCLNASLEMASILDDYAEYMVASEETTQGANGFSALAFINNISKRDNNVQIGKKFISSYNESISDLQKAYYTAYGRSYNIYSTYSILDLSKISKVESSVNEFFNQLDVKNNYNQIARVRSKLYQYAGSDDASFDMVDLYSLVSNLKSLSKTKAENLLSLLDECIVYNSSSSSESHGLSIYFPYNGSNSAKQMLLGKYSDFDKLTQYNTFIKDFYNIQTTSRYSYNFLNNTTNVSSPKNNSAEFQMTLTDDQTKGFAKAEYLVFERQDDGYYKMIYRGKNATLNNNKLEASIKGRFLKVSSKKEKGAEYIIPLIEEDETSSYIRYSTYVVLENFSKDFVMKTTRMGLSYDKKKNKIGIESLTIQSDNDLPSVVNANLSDYEYISFSSSAYKILDSKGNYTTNWEGNGIMRGQEYPVDDFEISLADFSKDAKYFCVFKIFDVNNKSYYSKLVAMN